MDRHILWYKSSKEKYFPLQKPPAKTGGYLLSLSFFIQPSAPQPTYKDNVK